MSKYNPLWESIQKDGREAFTLTFDEVHKLGGLEIDHSFLSYKKELLDYGYEVGKISLKNKTITFSKVK